jgi:hypothetical protein
MKPESTQPEVDVMVACNAPSTSPQQLRRRPPILLWRFSTLLSLFLEIKRWTIGNAGTPAALGCYDLERRQSSALFPVSKFSASVLVWCLLRSDKHNGNGAKLGKLKEKRNAGKQQECVIHIWWQPEQR